MDGKTTGGSNQKQSGRRLGRGLASLLSIPEVPIDSGSEPLTRSEAAPATTGAAGAQGSNASTRTVAGNADLQRAESRSTPDHSAGSPFAGRQTTSDGSRSGSADNAEMPRSTGNQEARSPGGEPGAAAAGTLATAAPTLDPSERGASRHGRIIESKGNPEAATTEASAPERRLLDDPQGDPLGHSATAVGDTSAFGSVAVGSVPRGTFNSLPAVEGRSDGVVEPASLGSDRDTGREGGGRSGSTLDARSPRDETYRTVSIAVTDITPNLRQPRQDFDPAAIQSLAESIRAAGLMQPIIVRPRRDKGPEGAAYELVAGERRWRAVMLLGMERVPAIVREIDDRTAAEWALIENVQREDLNPIERCAAVQRLIDEFGLTHQELGERLGLDRASISNLLRLCDLDSFTRDAVRTRRLSQGHAKALLGVSKIELRHSLARAAIASGWSVRELERRVQHALQPVPSSASQPGPGAPRASAHLASLEKRLSEHLGTRVALQLGRRKGTGRLIVDFYSLDQFDGLLARLGFSNESF
jgi:ParB family chromosome partitioning protein